MLRFGVSFFPPNANMDNPTIFGLAGIVLLTVSLILHTRKHFKREAQRVADRRAAAKAAKEAEQKRREMIGEPAKHKIGTESRINPTRVPLPAPIDPVFAGGTVPRNIATWETEIHQLGRQIIGQIDSKTVVLQTLTLEANRAANRLEILIDHLETLLKSNIAEKKPSTPTESVPEPLLSSTLPVPEPKPFEPSATQVKTSNLISASAANANAPMFSSVLDELESELDSELEQFEQRQQESVQPATILKPSPVESPDRASPVDAPPNLSIHRLPASFSLTPPNTHRNDPSIPSPPVHEPTTLDGPHRISASFSPNSRAAQPVSPFYSAPSGAVSSSASTLPFPSPPSPAQQSGLSFSSLFDDELADRQGESVFAVAGPGKGASAKEEVPAYKTPIIEQPHPSQAAKDASPENRFAAELGSHLERRKQVEMLADYGYSSRQIAQNLNLTIGEVELMLNLRK